MKNHILPGLLLLTPLFLRAQDCPPAFAQTDLHANNISARILNGGDLFTDWTEGRFQPNPAPDGSGPSTMFAAGLWAGGYTLSGLKMSAVTYRSGGGGFSAGPLDQTFGQPIDCYGWDRVFRVTADEIAAALQDNSPNAPSLYPNVYGWPGRENPHFESVNGFPLPANGPSLAHFWDVNSDGIYNPSDGDYPAVGLAGFDFFVPAEICFAVFHTGARNNDDGNLPLEVHLTAWAFDCPESPVLSNTIFTNHRFIHRGHTDIDSTFIGFWVDFDLGCYDNDFVGCDTLLESFYVYNQTVNEPATCAGGIPGFGDEVPTQSVTFLNKTLDRFMFYNNASLGLPPLPTTDPQTPQEYYNFMNATWRDGSPLTFGGSGYNSGGTAATHAFPSPPNATQGWNECLANLPYNDRRTVASHQAGHWQPGGNVELTCAWTVHAAPGQPCSSGNLTSDVADIREHYNTGFANVCMPLTAPETAAAALQLFPNPAAGQATLQYGDTDVLAIHGYRSDGRLMLALNDPQPGQTLLNLGGWPAGVYTLEIRTARGSIYRKLVVTP